MPAPSSTPRPPDSPKRRERAARRARRRAIVAARDLTADDTALARGGHALVCDAGVGPGGTVTLYESLALEPPTASLTAALRRGGIRVLMPLTEPDFDLDWFDAADPRRTPLGKGAIEQADLVFAPGLAVDRHGTRLGQGGGCYDRALPRRAAGVPVVILLHPGELVDGPLPRDPHDRPVDAVLTADGPVSLSPSGRGPAATGPRSPSPPPGG